MSDELSDRLFKIRMALMVFCAIPMVVLANVLTAKTDAGLLFFLLGNMVASVSIGMKIAENTIRKALTAPSEAGDMRGKETGRGT